MSAKDIAQSERAKGGFDFELVVAHILNKFLTNDSIVITRAKDPRLNDLIGESNLKRIMDFTKIPVKRRCDQAQLEDYPDLDLFALLRPENKNGLWRLLAIINCKVSFHARETEATFWGLLVRLSSNIPFVLVTEDRNIHGGKSSELGSSCSQSTRPRRLLESFTDGIYLVKRYENAQDPHLLQDVQTKQEQLRAGQNAIVFDDPTIPNHTQYCPSVRPIDDLINDLRLWKAEVLKREQNG